MLQHSRHSRVCAQYLCDDSLLFSPWGEWFVSCYIPQAGLECVAFLPQPPECWDYRHVPFLQAGMVIAIIVIDDAVGLRKLKTLKFVPGTFFFFNLFSPMFLCLRLLNSAQIGEGSFWIWKSSSWRNLEKAARRNRWFFFNSLDALDFDKNVCVWGGVYLLFSFSSFPNILLHIFYYYYFLFVFRKVWH